MAFGYRRFSRRFRSYSPYYRSFKRFFKKRYSKKRYSKKYRSGRRGKKSRKGRKSKKSLKKQARFRKRVLKKIVELDGEEGKQAFFAGLAAYNTKGKELREIYKGVKSHFNSETKAYKKGLRLVKSGKKSEWKKAYAATKGVTKQSTPPLVSDDEVLLDASGLLKRGAGELD